MAMDHESFIRRHRELRDRATNARTPEARAKASKEIETLRQTRNRQNRRQRS